MRLSIEKMLGNANSAMLINITEASDALASLNGPQPNAIGLATLAAIGPQDVALIPLLLNALDDPEYAQRAVVARTL